jgi:hypothetical protein
MTLQEKAMELYDRFNAEEQIGDILNELLRAIAEQETPDTDYKTMWNELKEWIKQMYKECDHSFLIVIESIQEEMETQELKQGTPDTDIPCNKCIHGTTCQHCDTDYNMFEPNTPDKEQVSEHDALEKAREIHGQYMKGKLNAFGMVTEITQAYETALQQERERADRYRDSEMQEYENSLTGVMSLLKNAQERAEAYKAVLQDLEEFFVQYHSEEITIVTAVDEIQDLKKKHGVSE